MITFRQKGNFNKTNNFLQKIRKINFVKFLNQCGEEGVKALESATPKDTGLTSRSWSYAIEEGKDHIDLIFKNSNINKGVPIAIILQYGHGTGTGGWVEGRDYINPAIQPLFDEFAKRAWEEVTRLGYE